MAFLWFSPFVIHNVFTEKCIAADQTLFFTLLAWCSYECSFSETPSVVGYFGKIPLTRWNMQGGRSDESLIEDREPSIEDGQTSLRRQSGETFLLQPVFLCNTPCNIKVSCWSRFMLNIEHWAACYIVNYFIGRLSFSESFSDFTESLVTFMYSFLLSYYRSKSV